MVDIIQLSPATILQPDLAHHMSQVLIHKPDTNKERRPITVGEDLACLVSALIGAALLIGLKNTKAYPPYVKAYCKGISCEELTLLQFTMMEGNHQHRHNVIAHLDDDEENFYDRITLEYQCACLPRLWCSPIGFAKWAAESLNNNNATIVTIKGLINVKFLCGLK